MILKAVTQQAKELALTKANYPTEFSSISKQTQLNLLMSSRLLETLKVSVLGQVGEKLKKEQD